jgi:hypothetical protein
MRLLKAAVYAVCLWIMVAAVVSTFAYFAFAWRAQGVETLVVGLLLTSLLATGIVWALLPKE